MVMIIKDLAERLSGLVGLGIIAIGVRFLLAPWAAAAGYGVAIKEEIGRPVWFRLVQGPPATGPREALG
jgi:hypothetical protein